MKDFNANPDVAVDHFNAIDSYRVSPTRKQQEVFRIEQDLLELPRCAVGHKSSTTMPHYQLPQELTPTRRVTPIIRCIRNSASRCQAERYVQHQLESKVAESIPCKTDPRAHIGLLQRKNGESSGTNGHGATGQGRGGVAVVRLGGLDRSTAEAC